MDLIKYKKRILIFCLTVLFLIPFSLVLAEEEKESFKKLSIKLKALQTAAQAGEYLKNNPNLTIKELQADLDFKNIAVQQVGETGYTAVIDVNSGYFYFHPQDSLVNTDAYALKDNLPDWWEIIRQTIGEQCKESSGIYKWIEDDGSITEKYMYLACVDGATADGKNLFVGATAYLDKVDALKYLEKYEIKKEFVYAKDAIKQKAGDVAKQIEIYLKINSEKTVFDLQQDDYFKEIAVQEVGKTGYTAVTDYNTLINRFHKNPKIIDMDLHDLAGKLPGFWSVMSKTEGGVEAEGIYDWEEADGSIKQKYMYIALVAAKTADNVGLSVAATTYLNEYEELKDSAIGDKNYSITEPRAESEEEVDLTIIIYWLTGGILIVSLILFILYRLKIIKFERKIVMVLLGTVLLIIITLFILNTYQITQKIKASAIDSFVKQQQILAERMAANINGDINFIVNNLTITSRHDDLLRDSKIKEFGVLERNLERLNNIINELCLLDDNGQNLVQVPSIILYDGIEDELGIQPSIVVINESHELVISDLYQTVSGENIFSVLTPIMKGNEFKGILKGNIRLLDFLERHVKPINFFTTGHAHLFVNNLMYSADGSSLAAPQEIIDNLARNKFGHIITPAIHAYDSVGKKKQDIITYYPVKMGTVNWGIVIMASEEDALSTVAKNLNRIWYFTIGIILAIIVIGVVFNFLLTASLKKEVISKTAEVQENARVIKEQLKKEEEITRKKEWLLGEQKKAKKDLEEKVDELEKFQKLTVDRELKMIDLKKEINKLKIDLNKK